MYYVLLWTNKFYKLIKEVRDTATYKINVQKPKLYFNYR